MQQQRRQIRNWLGGAMVMACLALSWVPSAGAATSTALYRITAVERIVKTQKSECVDTEGKSCPDQKTGYWRVTYQATSPYAPVQQHRIEMPSNPPKVGTVLQMTVNLDKADK